MNTKELREEFIKKYSAWVLGPQQADEITNWWLTKLQTHNKELAVAVRGMAVEIPAYHNNHPTVSERIGFNKGIEAAANIIEEN